MVEVPNQAASVKGRDGRLVGAVGGAASRLPVQPTGVPAVLGPSRRAQALRLAKGSSFRARRLTYQPRSGLELGRRVKANIKVAEEGNRRSTEPADTVASPRYCQGQPNG